MSLKLRWLTAASLVVVAATGAAGCATGGGDDGAERTAPTAMGGTYPGRSIVPPAPSSPRTTRPSDTLTVPAGSPLLDRLVGHRWITVERDGRRWPSSYAPYLEFESPPLAGETAEFVGGNDGCNWYSMSGALDGDRFVVELTMSTAMDCGSGTGGVMPADGDRAVVTSDGTRLELYDAAGNPRLVFMRLDSLDPSDTSALPGAWRLDPGAPSPVGFTEGGTMIFGTCGASWTLAGQLTVSGFPADPYSCLGGSQDQASSRLIEMLVGGPVAAHLRSESHDLYLTDEQFVIRLTEVDPQSDPDGTTLDTGAAFGYTPPCRSPPTRC